ncbi:MAG: N-acetyl sugar amidotransferase [Proteobacteria bacterium]|nr:N-acetyl sugar amidotransferase [Pseudomonadota bacterium]
MRYCRKCVMPETKPDLRIDEEGVCNACRSYENRKVVDWDRRKIEFLAMIERYSSKDGSNYDCMIPVSGGKDSTYQVLKLLELGFNPLCVTATTCQLSEIGRRNIENLKKLGVDYVEITINPNVRAKINRIGLRQVGDISWPEHLTIFTIPPRLAVQFGVPLLIWGENSQNEYGGPASDAENNVLTRRWLEEFGGLIGMRVTDLIGQDGLEAKDLIQFTYPSDEDLARVGVTGVFLGYYFPWDGYQNALVAQAYGFETLPTAIEGSLVNYFKYLKFGFCRVTDLACLHLRRGRLTRDQAIAIVKQRDGKFPWIYLGYPIQDVLKQIDMDLEEFIRICDRFTNKKLFKCDSRGNLIKDHHGNLTKINDDNVG